MRRFLWRLSGFAVLIFALNCGVAAYLAPRTTWDRDSKVHWVAGLEGRRDQFVVAGSSRAEYMVDPRLLEAEFGLRGVNIGCSGSGLTEQYLLLHRYLEHNTTRSVWLQVDYVSLSDYFTYPFRDYDWFAYRDDPEVARCFREVESVVYWSWRAAPFLRLMRCSSQLRFFLTTKPPAGSRYEGTLGALLRDEPYRTASDVAGKRVLSATAVARLREIVARCRQEGVALVFFQAPLSDEVAAADTAECDQWLADYARGEAIGMLDFRQLFVDRGRAMFFDKHHLNLAGVKEFSSVLGLQMRDRLQAVEER